MSTLHIGLLGPLEVRAGERKITLPPSKKTRALLAYLVLAPHPSTRQRLCELLWDGPDDPRAALRWSLSKLRAILANGVPTSSSANRPTIVTDGDLVSFEPGDSLIDQRQHAATMSAPLDSLGEAQLSIALRRFRGELLEGLELPDCYRFHEWCARMRESLRRDRLALLHELIRRLENRPEEALGCARMRVELEPLSEAAHIDLIQRLASLERPKDALRQYEVCRRMLELELGSCTSAELEAARASVQSTARSPRPTSPPEPQPGDADGRESHARTDLPTVAGVLSGATSTLLGRTAEVAIIRDVVQALSLQRESPPALLFLGEPGIGKSRLLQEVELCTIRAGGLFFGGRAFEAEMVRPYGIWTDALRSAPFHDASPEVQSELSPLFPGLSRSSSASGDRVRLFDAIGLLLQSLAQRHQRVVVALDDLQWVDEASAALVHALVRAASPSLLLALTARPGELEDNAPALRLIRGLGRASRLKVRNLSPLSRSHVESLVHQISPQADATWIASQSDGNPFFAIELGRAFPHPSSGHGPANAPGELPPTLDELLRDRLESLDEPARGLVRWAAVLGRSFDLRLLGKVAGLATPALLECVALLERRGVLRGAPAEQSQFGYDFVHDLLRRAAYGSIAPGRRKLYHAHVSRVLADEADPTGARAGEIAHHAGLGDEHERAARACVRAAERCVRIFAYAEAIELAELGRHQACKLPELVALPLEVDLLAVLADAGALTRDRDIEPALLNAASRAEQCGRQDLLFRVYHSLANVLHHRGKLVAAAASLERAAEAGRSADTASVVLGLANSGRCYAMLGVRVRRARELLDEAQQLAERHALQELEIVFGLACLRHFEGDYEQARVLFAHTLERAREAESHWQECECLVRMTTLALDCRQWSAACELSRELRTVATKMGDGGSEPRIAEALSAVSDWLAGDCAADERVARELVNMRELDAKGMLAFLLTALAGEAIACKDASKALAYCEEALVIADAMPVGNHDIIVRAALARACDIAGEQARAQRYFEEAIGALRKAEDVSQRARDHLGAAASQLYPPL